jgi:hypothetical protein
MGIGFLLFLLLRGDDFVLWLSKVWLMLRLVNNLLQTRLQDG